MLTCPLAITRTAGPLPIPYVQYANPAVSLRLYSHVSPKYVTKLWHVCDLPDPLRLCCPALPLLQAARRSADMQPWWLELAAARSQLARAAAKWRSECKILITVLHIVGKDDSSAQQGMRQDVSSLMGVLEANGYFAALYCS